MMQEGGKRGDWNQFLVSSGGLNTVRNPIVVSGGESREKKGLFEKENKSR